MFFEFVRAIAYIVFNTIFRVKVINKENVPKEGAVLLVSNHESFMDMFFIGFKLRRKVRWMAKEELFHNKLFAAFFTYFGAFPIKRGTGDSVAIRTTFELLKKGEVVGIFPQGTRSRGRGKELKAKQGAAKFAIETKSIILPVAVSGKLKLFGKIKIIFGKPFYLEADDSYHYSKEELAEMSGKIMDKIYGMIGE